MNLRAQRLCAWTGPLFGLLFLLGAVVLGRWLPPYVNPGDQPLVETWVGELITFIEEHRALLRILIAAEFDADPMLTPVADRISAFFAAQLQQLADDAGTRFVAGRQYNVPDPRVALAGGVSMALGMVLLDSWLIGHGMPRPSHDQIVDEISNMVMHGISSRPPDPRRKPRSK